MSKQSVIFLIVLVAMTAMFIVAGPANAAVLYNGDGDMVDGIDDGLVFGYPLFANDGLIIVVSGRYAWNHWNGMVEGGSGTIWHYGMELVDNQWVITKSHGTVKTDTMPPYHIWSIR